MEVITFQVGHFANHVGAHFWNFQDESAAREEAAEDDSVDYTRLFQYVEGHGGPSWRPRLLAIDRRGAAGAGFGEASVPAEVPEQCESWDGHLELLHADVVPKHPFQVDLEAEAEEGETGIKSSVEYDFPNTVRSWTDYLKVQLPSKSLYELREVQQGITPFAFYFDGLEVRQDEEESILDLARRQAEVCDQAEALQVIYDMEDGMGGITELMMRWAKEEMPKCGKFLMAVMPEETEVTSASRSTPELSWCHSMLPDAPSVSTAPLDYEATSWLSAAFSFARLLDCDPHVWVPVPVPLWSTSFDRNLYQASALPAAALDTALLPCRLRGSSTRASQWMTQLAPTHRPCCGLLQALPLPAAPAPVLGQPPGSNDTLEALAEAGSFFDLTRMPAAWANPYTSVVLRCPEERRLLNFTRRLPPSARRQSFVSEKELSLPITFPQASLAKAELESCPVVTQLHAAAGAKRCEALRQMANIVQMHQRSAWSATFKQRYGVEVDEFREVLELLKEHQETNADGSEDDDASD